MDHVECEWESFVLLVGHLFDYYWESCFEVKFIKLGLFFVTE